MKRLATSVLSMISILGLSSFAHAGCPLSGGGGGGRSGYGGGSSTGVRMMNSGGCSSKTITLVETVDTEGEVTYAVFSTSKQAAAAQNEVMTEYSKKLAKWEKRKDKFEAKNDQKYSKAPPSAPSFTTLGTSLKRTAATVLQQKAEKEPFAVYSIALGSQTEYVVAHNNAISRVKADAQAIYAKLYNRYRKDSKEKELSEPEVTKLAASLSKREANREIKKLKKQDTSESVEKKTERTASS